MKMDIIKKQELIDRYVEGVITQEEFKTGLKGLCKERYKGLCKEIYEELLYRRSITKYGRLFQVDLAIEEMAELTQALCKSKRDVKPTNWLYNIYEEMVDVQIMLDALKIVFSDVTTINDIKVMKLERLEKLLELKEGGEEV